MHISNAFTDMHSASKKLYAAAADYNKARRELEKTFTDNLDMSVKDERKIRKQIESFRKTANAGYIKDSRDKVESQRRAAFNQAKAEFKAASENLAETVAAFQPSFDVNSQDLQNALNVAKIGRDLPESAVRNLLQSLRTNKSNFDIVRGALQRAGVNPDYIQGIYPYDGESMQYEYDLLVDNIMNHSADPSIYSDIAKLETRLVNDGEAFGVPLSRFVDDESKAAAGEARTRRAMGLEGMDVLSEL